ncbi:MAG: hypothetical protein ACFFA3_13780 [Promethearchaeota archaeon]
MSFTDYQRKVRLTIINSLVYGIVVLFIGLVIGFFFYYYGIHNPAPHNIVSPALFDDPTYYEKILRQIGYYDPWYVQFGLYFLNFFKGNWGESFIVAEGEPVIDILAKTFPRTIGILIVPLLIGLLGIKLGKSVIKKRNSAQSLIIRIFTIIGFAIPIFFLATLIQFCTLLPGFEFPAMYIADPYYYPLSDITGFPLFDSIINGNWKLAGSIIEHAILPIFILSFLILAIVIKQTQNHIERKTEETAFVSNSLTAAKLFGIFFALVITLEVCFNRTGFGYRFIQSVYLGDIFLSIGCLYLIIILFSFTIFLTNIIPIVYNSFKKFVFDKAKNFKRIVYKKKFLIPKIAIGLTVIGLITPTMGLLDPDGISFLWYLGFYVRGSGGGSTDSGFVNELFVSPLDYNYLMLGTIIIILMVIGIILLLIPILKTKNNKMYDGGVVLSIVGGFLIFISPIIYYSNFKEYFSSYWNMFYPPSFGFVIPIIAGILGIISGILTITEYKLNNENLSHFSEQEINMEQNEVLNFRNEFKNYIITSLKNPFVIIGLTLLMSFIILSIFPYFFTSYSINEIVPPDFPPDNPFESPSYSHPFGTTKYGFDVLARVIYGIQDALIFGIVITIIGLLFGSIFGYMAGRYHRYVHYGIIGTLIIFLIIPGIMLLAVANTLFYALKPRFISILIVGLLLTVVFAGIIANAIRRESNLINRIKMILKSIPLEVAFGIILYQTLGFFGLIDISIPQLGISCNWARSAFGKFWALWPGVFLFLLLLSLILIHEGLKTPTKHKRI